MAFLFKSSKKTDKNGLPPATRGITSSDGSNTPGTGSYGPSRDGQGSRMGGAAPPPMAPPGAMVARGATPDQVNLRDQNRAAAGTPQRPPPDMSLYPWSKRKIDFATSSQSPFPRYGAASNALSSPKGDIYLMGGLINGAMVKGDLWIVEAAGSGLSCTPIATMAEGPGPRVGHRALLVGNAFIVFGGDTKVEEMDVLDDTLYLLNTSTRHWSRALPAGPRPAGRYGHTLNILGSKIFIFGGQVEGFFFNDLVAFDLNALQQPTNRWEILIANSADGGPPTGQVPPARTNHTVVTWNDRLYLFGGTDGVKWYNDVWCYEARTNAWSCLECIGFIPAAREGHSAAIVGDVMYIFGGRTEEGKDLGDLAAFRIPTKRWYTFQNMGPAPTPRSGHCMTAYDNHIYVLGGEPSSQPEDPAELGVAFVLDTSKIRYPADNPQQNGVRNGSRRPSVTDRSDTPQQRTGSAQGQYSNSNTSVSRLRNGSQDSANEGAAANRPIDINGPPGMYGQNPAGRPQRPPGAAPGGPLGPPPGVPPPTVPMQQQQQQQQRGQPPIMNGGVPRPFVGPDGRESPRPLNRPDRLGSNAQAVQGAPDSAHSGYTAYQPPVTRDAPGGSVGPAPQLTSGGASAGYTPYSINNTQATAPPTATAPAPANPPHMTYRAGMPPYKPTQQSPPQTSNVSPSSTLPMTAVAAAAAPQAMQNTEKPAVSQPPPAPAQAPPEVPSTRAVAPSGSAVPVDSGVGSSPALSQNENLAKELEILRSRNTWYSSELALARKAGYRSNVNDSQGGEERSVTAEAMGEDDKPMMEALLKMRNELINMQETLARERGTSSERISRAEKQRDAAINEAVYSRTRLRGGKDTNYLDERNDDAQRRLAAALNTHNDLQTKIRALTTEAESERKARQLAEESADIAHSRAAELDTHKQSSSSELERLRAELHEAEKSAREALASAAEHQSNASILSVDKNELAAKLNAIQTDTQDHNGMLVTLREAVTSSTEKAALLEKKLEHERLERTSAQEKLAQLKSEHEARVSELETTTRRLQDAEELAASSANEAQTHRAAVLAGFGKSQDRAFDVTSHADERVVALQKQLDAANDNVHKNQEAADHASERLRKAEERIAGLEAYQEQASREGLSMRKQLQVASRDAVTLHSEKAELQESLTSEKMSATALSVQHNALKDVLAERGIDVANLPAHGRNRSVDSTVTNERLRELEAQLESSKQAHEDMRASFVQREADASKGWEEKLAALDSDYQAAVKYLKGTEKMLSRMKSELHRYKGENRKLEDQLAAGGAGSTAWETERNRLRNEVDDLQARVASGQEQLEAQMSEARAAADEREAALRALDDAQKHHDSTNATLREHNAQLEQRAHEAEQRVQTLLDTVGTSVANYRHSQQVNGLNPTNGASAASATGAAGTGGVASPAHGHSRGLSASSTGDESSYSAGGYEGGAGDGRNSVALDSLATELETLRSHWETTNKNYRSSGQSVTVTTPQTPSVPGAFGGPEGESLVSWRKKLEIEEREAESRRESEHSGISGGAAGASKA